MPLCSDNINPLYNNPFKLVISRDTDQMELMVQKVNLPGLSLNDQPQPTIFGTTIPVPTLAANFESLNVEFIVDSDLQNWKSIYSWMRNMANIENDSSNNLPYQNWHWSATLFVFGPQASPTCSDINLQVKFTNIIPTALSGLNFRSDSMDLDVLKASCKFKYSYYTLEPDASNWSAPSY